VSKDELSRASWIGALGVVVAILSVFLVGLPIAAELVPTNDEAGVAGLVWGMLGGCVLGGGIVGLICGRTGLSRIRFLTWLIAPGALISIPMLISAILASEWWHGLRYALVLVPSSGAAAKLGAALTRRKEPLRRTGLVG
jgi:hypothetical protein